MYQHYPQATITGTNWNESHCTTSIYMSLSTTLISESNASGFVDKAANIFQILERLCIFILM
jgi:RES domain-containing protein